MKFRYIRGGSDEEPPFPPKLILRVYAWCYFPSLAFVVYCSPLACDLSHRHFLWKAVAALFVAAGAFFAYTMGRLDEKRAQEGEK